MNDSQPNPFSREGSQPADGLGSDAGPPNPSEPAVDPTRPVGQPADGASAGTEWPTYPPAAPPAQASAADPYPAPAYGADPYAAPAYGADPYGTALACPHGTAPYGTAPYGTAPYGTAPYAADPYAVAPYPNSYGSYGTPALQHPRAVPALIMGILSIVLGLMCGVGGLLGIGGIVLGRAARSEIDAQPGRWEGRSAANAGFITGTVGVVICALVVVGVILVVLTGMATP